MTTQPYILYPFQFKEMVLTDRALDALGFTPYWSGPGDSGTRQLDLSESGAQYRLRVMDGSDDCNDGWGEPQFCPYGYIDESGTVSIYFLHDLYEDIKAKRSSEELASFIEATKGQDVNMYYYIESYMKYIEAGDLLVHF